MRPNGKPLSNICFSRSLSPLISMRYPSSVSTMRTSCNILSSAIEFHLPFQLVSFDTCSIGLKFEEIVRIACRYDVRIVRCVFELSHLFHPCVSPYGSKICMPGNREVEAIISLSRNPSLPYQTQDSVCCSRSVLIISSFDVLVELGQQ